MSLFSLRRAAVFLALAGAIGTASAQSGNAPVAQRLPDAGQIERDYAPDSVRQAGACQVMTDAIILLAPKTVFSRHGADAERYDGYLKCNSKYMVPIYGEGEDATQRALAITQSEEFEKSVAKRYLTPTDYDRWLEQNRDKWKFRASEQSSMARGNAMYFWFMISRYFGLLLLGALFAWWTLRPWRYDSNTGLLCFGWRTFTIYRSAGVVAEASAGRSTTYVPGSTTTRTDAQGWTSTSTTPGHSYSTLHETIHLIDKQGGEIAMRLDDWNISARTGHLIGTVHAIRKGKSTGPYLRIWNFSLNEQRDNTAALNKMFGLGFLGWAAVVATTGWALFIVLLLLANLDTSHAVRGLGQTAILGPLAGGVVVATALHLWIRHVRRKRFDSAVAAPMYALTERDARAAAERTRGPVSRAD